ncbi:MAG: peptidylprolyl isomerase, partial [Bacteroidota bacterium]
AMAFASIQDASALDSLQSLLRDDIEEVRVAAAYAIGQIGSERGSSALVEAFVRDSLADNFVFRAALLEAIGKCGPIQNLKFIATAGPYYRTDTTLLEGQAWSIYRYALRRMVLPEGTDRMVRFLTKTGYPDRVRFIAANYLYRVPKLQLDSLAVDGLAKLASIERDPNILLPLAIALGKSKAEVGLRALEQMYGSAKDYRVKCNVIRALGNFPYEQVNSIVLGALDDTNLHVAITAAQFMVDYGNPREARNYWQKAKAEVNLPWQVSTRLLTAANRHIPGYFVATRGNINQEIKQRLLDPERNVYEKSALMRALGEFGWNYRFIKEEGYASDKTIVRSASVEALANIVRQPEFDKFFGLGARRVKKDMAAHFQEAIERGDIAMMTHAASALREPSLDFIAVVDSIDFMTEALNKLKLPKETEIYYELKKTIDFFIGKKGEENPPPEYNHPLDWGMINDIRDDATATIALGSGASAKTVKLKLFKDKAPGSVANFIQLAKNNFFNGKNFHRVIPNFVIQGGCPRGDGYGGLDYSIRSELPPLNYDDEGYVGMASAGKHTECTQWFITHAPTPHLDGRYTIFAKVIEGMEAVHQVQIGDVITSITIN